jgi:hypothetical protein
MGGNIRSVLFSLAFFRESGKVQMRIFLTMFSLILGKVTTMGYQMKSISYHMQHTEDRLEYYHCALDQ